jgi:hypothetical protein
MKVLHLRESGADATLALHPQVTVVRGLDPHRRAWLVEALAKLSDGTTSAEGGIDAHGIRFPLDGASLALLGLDHQVAAVVTASDLPGHDPARAVAAARKEEAAAQRRRLTDEITTHRTALGSAVTERDAAGADLEALRRGEGAAREALAAAEATRTRIEAEQASAATARAEAERVLADAVLARDAAAEARAASAARVADARARHQAAIAAAGTAAAALEEARSVGAEDPTDDLAAARDELARAEQAAAEEDPDHDSSPLNRRLADLERRRAELVRLEEALGPAEQSPVADALEGVLGSSSEAPPVVAALALADTWRDLHQQIRALDAGVSPAEQAAEDRVAMARRSVGEAEADFNQPVLTPEQIAKVEAAHAAVLEAQDRTEGRFGGARARKRLDELRNEERRILERLGFSTYADYMMSSSSRGVGPANRAILDAARAQLNLANEELTRLPGAADRARRRAELLQRRDAVAPRVADLIGHEPTGPEAEEELRALREPVAPDGLALKQLADELGAVGIVVGPEPHDRDDLVLLARSYLAEQHTTEARRTEVSGALAALDAAIDSLRQAREAGEVDLPEAAPLPELAEPVPLASDPDAEARAVTLREARWADVEAARARVSELEELVGRHRSASDELSGLQQELDRLTEAEAAAAAEVAAAEADAALADGPALVQAEADVAAAEGELTRARSREAELADELATAGATGVEALIAAAEERLRAAEAAVADAAAAEQATATELATADAEHAAASSELDALVEAAEAVDPAALVEDVHWELLSRLAALRSVGHAGSVPLVLDDPFAALDDAGVATILERIAAMSGAVQVVVVSDRPAVGDWALAAGPERAALVAA